jgi:AcrR family transcriptional regulator
MRQLRRDAARNRELLVHAAMMTFRDEGLDVALDTIARRAGVGNATLYRNFPSREDLYEAVFADVQGQLSEALSRYTEVDDGREALHAFLIELFTISPASSELGRLAEQLMEVLPALRETAAQVRATMRRLLTLAQRQGTVRPDVDFWDFDLLLTSIHPVMVASDEVAPNMWRRHLILILDALRPENPSILPSSDATTELREQVTHTAQGC